MADLVQTTSPLAAVLADPTRLAELDVDKLQTMVELHRRLEADRAEREFAAAFNTVQNELEPVRKTTKNPHTGSLYARVEDIDRMLSPVIQRNGFSTSFSHRPSDKPDRTMLVMTLRHTSGHKETHEWEMPSDHLGPKGQAVKTLAQGSASANTYFKRHLKCSVFDIQLGADVDGNAPTGDPITESQAADLQTLMDEVGADKGRFLRYFKVGSVGDLVTSQHREAVRMLEQKRQGA